MEVRRYTVAELRAPERASGEAFETIVVLRKCTERTARNGTPFLVVACGDRTGTCAANLCSDDAAADTFRTVAEGPVLRVLGRIESYQGRFSPRINEAHPISEDELV